MRPLDAVRAPPFGGARSALIAAAALLGGEHGDAPVGARGRQRQPQLLRGERQGVDRRRVRRRLKGEALPGMTAAAAAALDPEQHSVVERGGGQEAAAEARVRPGDGPDGALVAGELGELGDGLSGDVEDLRRVCVGRKVVVEVEVEVEVEGGGIERRNESWTDAFSFSFFFFQTFTYLDQPVRGTGREAPPVVIQLSVVDLILREGEGEGEKGREREATTASGIQSRGNQSMRAPSPFGSRTSAPAHFTLRASSGCSHTMSEWPASKEAATVAAIFKKRAWKEASCLLSFFFRCFDWIFLCAMLTALCERRRLFYFRNYSPVAALSFAQGPEPLPSLFLQRGSTNVSA